MSKKKQTKLGHDPLAWISKDENPNEEIVEIKATKECKDKILVEPMKKNKLNNNVDENQLTEDIAGSKIINEKKIAKNEQMIVLGTINDISSVAELHKNWEKYLTEPAVTIDASAVERIDTTTLQLLVIFIKQAKENNIEVKWQDTSGAMNRSINLLGLEGTLMLS